LLDPSTDVAVVLEERNWIAALTMIGLQKEALEQASLWQVWDGAETSQSSMNNAVLSRNAFLYYRLEDGIVGRYSVRIASCVPALLLLRRLVAALRFRLLLVDSEKTSLPKSLVTRDKTSGCTWTNSWKY
jgi:hypothetical protein